MFSAALKLPGAEEMAVDLVETKEMGPPFDSVHLVYKWLNSMVYGRYNELVNGD